MRGEHLRLESRVGQLYASRKLHTNGAARDHRSGQTTERPLRRRPPRSRKRISKRILAEVRPASSCVFAGSAKADPYTRSGARQKPEGARTNVQSSPDYLGRPLLHVDGIPRRLERALPNECNGTARAENGPGPCPNPSSFAIPRVCRRSSPPLWSLGWCCCWCLRVRLLVGMCRWGWRIRNDQNLSNSHWLYAIRFVLDRDTTMYRFFSQMKAKGAKLG